MNNIITIHNGNINGNSIQTVNARDLHEFLEVKSAFKDWIARRVSEYEFTEGEDYILIAAQEKAAIRGGHNRKDYHISLDMAKELSMVERNAKGKEARQYFIQCEKIAKEPKPTKLPTTTELALMVIQAEEEKAALVIENQVQACKIINLEPKATSFDNFVSSEGLINLRMAMREINAMPNKAIKYLKEAGHLFSEGKNASTPKGHLTARGYFKVKPSKNNRDGKVYPQTMVTPRGVSWLDSIIPSDLRIGGAV